MHVDEIMNPRVSSLDESRSVLEALRLLSENDESVVPVTKEGKCVGVLSLRAIERELLRVFQKGVDATLLASFLGKKVSELMMREAPLLELDSEVVTAIDCFLESGLDSLPVIDSESKSLCGVVSAREIIQAARTLFDD